MKKDGLSLVSFVALVVFAGLLVSNIGITYAQKQLFQYVFATNSTKLPSTASNVNITLGNPQFIYTAHDRTTGLKPVINNGTHWIELFFTGHGVLNGMNITDSGKAEMTNGTGGTIFTNGDEKLVSKNGAGTLVFGFQTVGTYGADGKLTDIGQIFEHHREIVSQHPVPLKTTGNLAFLQNVADGVYKEEIDKAGNAVTKIWFWKP